jgi:hypothetical protein
MSYGNSEDFELDFYSQPGEAAGQRVETDSSVRLDRLGTAMLMLTIGRILFTFQHVQRR